MIEAKDIKAFYGKKQILFGTSLKIGEGERVLLIGPNGAGKSTLLKVIIGIHNLSKGAIYLNGVDITHLPTEKRTLKGIGFLLQSENIVPGLTVDENLILGGYPLKGRRLAKRKDAILEIFNFLNDKLSIRAGLLSGGERQALAIGMILMKQPVVLFLDEPSAGLAPKAASQIIRYIEDAQKLLGIKAVCIVEHNLKLSLPWATKVVVLVNGRLVHESSTPEQYIRDTKTLETYYFGSEVIATS